MTPSVIVVHFLELDIVDLFVSEKAGDVSLGDSDSLSCIHDSHPDQSGLWFQSGPRQYVPPLVEW